jgi:transcriptional regulator with XRE-family HTH domain
MIFIMDNITLDDKRIWEEIANRIKELRRTQGLSMNALAKKTGFTKSYLSHIENLKREPTVGALLRIARALTVSVTFLIDGEKTNKEEDSIVVARRENREVIPNPFRYANTLYESLNSKMKDRLMDGYIVTPPFDFSEDPIAHEGQELFFVLEGSQELIHDGKSYILNEGDCCYFDSSKLHRARSVGEKLSKVLIVFTAKS